MTSNPWLAPVADTPVRATVSLPGSKSVTNRALALAALSDQPSVVRNALRARDTHLMAAALRALGAGVDDSGTDWAVSPRPLRGDVDVDCGLSGTVTRFLLAVAPLAGGQVRFDGDPQARVRPMGELAAALRALGADVHGDRLPLRVEGNGGLAGGEVTLDASASSQFVSALLLAGCRYDKGSTVHHVGPALPSVPYVTMTARMLASAGIDVDEPVVDGWRVRPGTPRAGDVTVEPDLMNAAPFLAAAVLTGGEVCVTDWPAKPLQAADRILEVLGELGGAATASSTGLVMRGGNTVAAVDVDLRDVSELVPTVTALACFADGPSRIRGVRHIRGHETNRLAALVETLTRLGGRVTELADGLAIEPAPLTAGTFGTYHDHRMATAGALVGLRVPGLRLDDVTVTGKTLPDFPRLWHRMLA